MLKLKKILFAVCCLLFAYTKAQTNLVPNPSFEIYTACPDTLDEINDATYWVNPTGYTPDYYNACALDTGCCGTFGVPKNYYGYQPARTGVAYAGIITEFEDAGNSLREYIQVQLIQPLLPATSYYVEFYVCYADSNCYAVNDIGAYFSAGAVSSTNDSVLPYIPQVSNNNMTNPLTTKNIWIKVSGTFTASGGENYLTIGNFKNDVTSDTVKTNSEAFMFEYDYSYYYIDDVLVTYSDSMITGENKINTYAGDYYPNPCHDYIYMSANVNTIIIESMQGERELLFNMCENPDKKLNISVLENGIYIMKVSFANQQISSYKLIKS